MNSTGDESACTDELKVYKDEGEEEEQKKSSENLTEDKVGLVIEGEGHVSNYFFLFLTAKCWVEYSLLCALILSLSFYIFCMTF